MPWLKLQKNSSWVKIRMNDFNVAPRGRGAADADTRAAANVNVDSSTINAFRADKPRIQQQKSEKSPGGTGVFTGHERIPRPQRTLAEIKRALANLDNGLNFGSYFNLKINEQNAAFWTMFICIFLQKMMSVYKW